MRSFSKTMIKLSIVLIILGIIFTTVGFCTGGRWLGYQRENSNLSDVNKDFTETIESLDLRIEVGKLTVKQGEDFKVVAENIEEDTFLARVENNTLIVDNSNTNEFSIFGIELNPFYLGFGENNTPNITVYVPESFMADKLKVYVAAGSVNLEDLTANSAELNVGAGELTGNNLVLKEDAQITVDAGDMSLNQIDATNLIIDCSVGNVDLSGNIYGHNSITCSVGNVEFDLEGAEEDYYFNDVDQSLGEVTINNRRYSKQAFENNAEAATEISIDCSVGSVSVDTN